MGRRVLVSGDRWWNDREMIRRWLHDKNRENPITVLIEGEADGADKIAREIAEEMGIPVDPYPADWLRYKKAAGPIRNSQMLTEGKPDLVGAFHDELWDKSRGTKDMVEKSTKAGVPTEWMNHKHAGKILHLFRGERDRIEWTETDW